jgi:hypothetical protein
MRRTLVIASISLLVGCNNGDRVINVSDQVLPLTIDLHVGESVRIGDENYTITFDSVTEDSRCPKGLECFWEGDACTRLTIRQISSGAKACTLHTTLNPKSITVEPIAVDLKRVAPYPQYESRIESCQYIATLTLAKVDTLH